jgi:hypothetical protein
LRPVHQLDTPPPRANQRAILFNRGSKTYE